MLVNRDKVASFLFDIWSKFPWKQHFSVVEDSHYTWIPSTLPNLYLLIQKPKEVIRILARVDHTELTSEDQNLIWLSAQTCSSEAEKYGKHLPVHWFYSIVNPDMVIKRLM